MIFRDTMQLQLGISVGQSHLKLGLQEELERKPHPYKSEFVQGVCAVPWAVSSTITQANLDFQLQLGSAAWLAFISLGLGKYRKKIPLSTTCSWRNPKDTEEFLKEGSSCLLNLCVGVAYNLSLQLCMSCWKSDADILNHKT